VFTARYALSPYIKQIRFVFKGLTSTWQMVTTTWIWSPGLVVASLAYRLHGRDHFQKTQSMRVNNIFALKATISSCKWFASTFKSSELWPLCRIVNIYRGFSGACWLHAQRLTEKVVAIYPLMRHDILTRRMCDFCSKIISHRYHDI
jgi:hypothetical protein